MRFSRLLLPVLATLSPFAVDASSPSARDAPADLTVAVTTSPILPSLTLLNQPPLHPPPPSAAAGISSTGIQAHLYAAGLELSVPLTARNTFEFTNVPSGRQYLLTVTGSSFAFYPYRVDVGENIKVHTTFMGHEWSNLGESIPVSSPQSPSTGNRDNHYQIDITPRSPLTHLIDRPTFRVFDLFKNPMILIGLLSLIVVVGMPKLLNSMDDETRAEFEAMQQKGPLSGLQAVANGGQHMEKKEKDGSGVGNRDAEAAKRAMQDFDVAGWLAGKK